MNSVPPAVSPRTADDAEVASQRAPGQEEVVLEEPQGDLRIDQLSGSAARRPSPSSTSEAAGFGALCGAGKEGQEEEDHGDSKEYP